MKKIANLLMSLFLVIGCCSSVYAAPSPVVDKIDAKEDHNFNEQNQLEEDPFDLDTEYIEGMTEEEIHDYYYDLQLIVTKPFNEETASDDYKISEEMVENLTAVNNNELSFTEFKEIYNVNLDDLIETMFERYPDLLTDTIRSKVSNSSLAMLSEFEDIYLYDTNGEIVHGTNIHITLTFKLLNENIDPDYVFILHYDVHDDYWELLPISNVDTVNHTCDVLFPSLSPICFLYIPTGNTDNPSGDNTNTGGSTNSGIVFPNTGIYAKSVALLAVAAVATGVAIYYYRKKED